MSTDVLVLNQKLHGLDPATYRDELQNRLEDATVELAPTASERRASIGSARVVTGGELTAAEIERASGLELFACIYAGTDHLPLETFAEQGVVVTNASGVHASNAAEQAIGFVLTFARRLHDGIAMTRNGSWQHYRTGELAGSTVAVIGMGAIGTAILRRLEPFDVERIGVRHSPEKDGPAEEIAGYEEFESVAARSDFLVAACPLTETTRGLIDGEILAVAPPDAVIVNLARGPVVDTDALVAALRRNDVGAAGLDVTDPEPLPDGHPLWSLEDCIVTPHNAGYTPQYLQRRADILARNYRRLDGTEPLENRVQ